MNFVFKTKFDCSNLSVLVTESSTLKLRAVMKSDFGTQTWVC
jgi:hypothetical protein